MNNNDAVKTILILAANPTNTSRLRLEEEIREIDEGLRRANQRHQYKLEQKLAVRSRDFYRAILDYQPQIVHFCGHGAGQDGIVLEDDTGKMVLLETKTLASMFKLFAKKSVECVILNACYSEVQAEAISQYVDYVLGMKKAVGDKAAVAFSVAFYDALAAGYEVEEAYDLGCSQMMSFLEQETPVFKKKPLIPTLINTDVPVFDDVIPPNPYQGLAAFEEEDSDFFFGQENFINKLVEVTQNQPLVGIIGPSGSGKSSVVFAGLIPNLRKQGNWLIEVFRPGKEPFLPLASALVRQLEPEAGETQLLRESVALASDFQQGRITVQQVISRILERNPGKRLLLVADQLEELYTLCPVKEEQERFADELLAAIAQENITVVFTLRADFLNYVLSYRPFRDALQTYTPQFLSSMKREELQQAIELPAQKLDVQLEDNLTQRILDDVGQEPGNLPLLEFALTRLWEKQKNRTLTHAAYQEIGGVKKAIANHAEQVYQKLSETEKQQAQRIFVQLVRPGEGTEDTRRVATRAEVGEENWNLVSYLAGYQARLVVTGRQETEDTVEVVHEALIREWLTLREWMNANRQFRTWQERLKLALREWKNDNHNPGTLLRGVSLTVAADWLGKRANEMTQDERNFIQVSVQQQKRRRQFITFAISSAFIVVSSFGIVVWSQSQKIQLAQSEALSDYSNELFKQNKEIDALIKSLQAAKPSYPSKKPPTKVLAALQQAVYWIHEHNRFEGHSGLVWEGSFSPDSQNIVSANSDKTSKIWSIDGRSQWNLPPEKYQVRDATFSPDGQIVATTSGNKVKLWSLKNRQLLTILEGHQNTVYAVSFSPDGQMIATASKDKTVKLWTQKGKFVKTLVGHQDLVQDVMFSPNGQMIATASKDKTVKLWQRDGKLLRTLSGHQDNIENLSFSPDGQIIATASFDKTVKLWTLNGKVLTTLNGHEDVVYGVNFSPDGKILATASGDKTIKLWKLDGTLLRTIIGSSGRVYSVNFSPNGKWFITGGEDRSIRLWQRSNPLLTMLEGYTDKVLRIRFRPDQQRLVTLSEGNRLEIWQPDGTRLKTRKFSKEIRDIDVSSDGKWIATVAGDEIQLWSWDGKVQQTIKTNYGLLYSVRFSPDNRMIATSSEKDNVVQLWQLDGKLLHTFRGHQAEVQSISFSSDGQTLATAGFDKTIKLWSQDGQLLQTLKGHQDIIYSVAFSPDDQTLASGSQDKTVILWRRNAQGLYLKDKTLKGHEDIVWDVSFSPKGDKIVTASHDTTARIWKSDGTLLQILQGHQGAIVNARFSPDGETVALASTDKTASLWKFEHFDQRHFEDLMQAGCAWVHDYLKNNPNVNEEDRQLCDNIPFTEPLTPNR
ncbi:MAG: CHAT domain-containing protein [Planktothrix agardhii LY1]|uniref:nSTAND1 domain-containing NTPase n=1 Tax=Planktothrix agardhii TaxID=1160 RepID=UPI00242D38A6|nr:CHAT domain-containing protein [Planktothrix agardhii]MCP9293195.1 CHAT domain-containing protein [Planktothrix agardhii LY1]